MTDSASTSPGNRIQPDSASISSVFSSDNRMNNSLVLDKMPEDILYLIIAPIFAEQVLNAFDATFPRVKKYDSVRPFVDEMSETLMFKGVFTLLHVSRSFRDVTGRLLMKAVPASAVDTQWVLLRNFSLQHTRWYVTSAKEKDTYIRAVARLECSALLCIYISRNNSLSDVFNSNFYHELVSRTQGIDLISSPLVQTYGFINRLRSYAESFTGISIRHRLPECPVDLDRLEMDGYALKKMGGFGGLPTYYGWALRQAYVAHRELLAGTCLLLDTLQWCLWVQLYPSLTYLSSGTKASNEGRRTPLQILTWYARHFTPRSIWHTKQEKRITAFHSRIERRKDLSTKFARSIGHPCSASSLELVTPAIPRQLVSNFPTSKLAYVNSTILRK